MALAIFDLDNTLLNGDSDYLWGRFLGDEDLVDAKSYELENKRFYDEYKAGTLDILEFLAFSLKPLSEHSMEALATLHEKFMATVIRPLITDSARQLLEKHRKNGDYLLIITATNDFITAPIARELGVDDIIATNAEIQNGRYTGKVADIPCFREGKVTRLQQWLKLNGQNLANSWFYSDSLNDLPLLEQVSHPVAVDPDDTLADHAAARDWPILSLKGAEIITLKPGA